ncbi:hypothetical protein [Nocardia africana]|uniref:hypothetical protein n=1 Tax=Nocardia africana TaxID=134964 RepID=UPI000FE1A4FA|nr:hypothetical protein [Nocardia africana]MCC3315394.1 hypothetical protein [Nocardia africana]
MCRSVSDFCAARRCGAGNSGRVYDYHPGDQSYRYEGQHGTFTGEAIYATQNADGGNRLIWSLRLSPSVQAVVQGPMSCGASVVGKSGYHDFHPSIPADYWWHSAVTDLQLDRTYRLEATCDFTATNGHTTAPGNVRYTVEFTRHSR